MKLRIIIILTLFSQAAFAQNLDSIMAHLNQPFQDKVQYHLDTMFNGQDTIFTETDSFILYTTPDMVIPEIDTLEYVYDKNNTKAININGDELEDIYSIVNLRDKRTGEPVNKSYPQFLLLAVGTEEGYDLAYFNDIMACLTCGMGGGTPDFSLLANYETGLLELVETTGNDEFVYNNEYFLSFEENDLLTERYIFTTYHNESENTLVEEYQRDKMMQVNEYEAADGEVEKFRNVIFPAIRTEDITVDGTLDESFWNDSDKRSWRPLHATTFGEKHTRNDLFARYNIGWDKRNLYIATKVIDDKLVPLFSDNPDVSSGDYITMTFDFDTERIQDGELRKKVSNKSFSINIGFDKLGNVDMSVNGLSVVLEHSKAAFGRTDNGYDLELRLAQKDIIKIAEDFLWLDGSSFNFNIEVNDADNRETSEIENTDASSRATSDTAYKMAKVELFNTFRKRNLEEVKRN